MIPMKDWRFIGCYADYESANTVLFGAPFDGTVSFRPGARFAPAQMRAESFGIETYSPYFDADLERFSVCDLGDIDLPIGNTIQCLNLIEKMATNIFTDGKKPLMIGGEHLVTAPVIKAAAARYPGLAVIHFDAHADLRQDYLGETLSHSTTLRRIHDILGDGAIWQFGIRSGTMEEFAFAAQGHTFLRPFTLDGVAEAVRAIGSRPVYLTIDMDVLDPSIFPGTGTPEAGGVTFREFMAALLALRGLNFIGADVVELSPHYDPTGVSTAVACKVVREVAILINDK